MKLCCCTGFLLCSIFPYESVIFLIYLQVAVCMAQQTLFWFFFFFFNSLCREERSLDVNQASTVSLLATRSRRRHNSKYFISPGQVVCHEFWRQMASCSKTSIQCEIYRGLCWQSLWSCLTCLWKWLPRAKASFYGTQREKDI